MKSVAELQRHFQNFVMHGSREVHDVIIGDERASAEERLNVYFDAYRIRLLGILETEFPGIGALTTGDQFRELGLKYLDAYPSGYPSVRWFAQHFAELVEAEQERLGLPHLAEMARFEWARGLAFDAPDSDALRPGSLANLPGEQWPGLRIALHPSVQQVDFAFNTDELWRSIKAGEALPRAEARADPAACCVWRRDLTIYWRVLDAAEAAALGDFANGHDFAEVCANLSNFREPSEIPAMAATFLSQWFADGLITEITT